MTSGLDTCIEALRFLARSSELEATRLITAELRIHEFLAPVALMPTALRASLEELDNAVNQEAAFGLDAASFWEGVRDASCTAYPSYKCLRRRSESAGHFICQRSLSAIMREWLKSDA
jgi:hypothetical protein